MRYVMLIAILIGAQGCASVGSDAAFCGPGFTGAIERLADALPDPMTPDAVGQAGTAVVLAHDAGCAK